MIGLARFIYLLALAVWLGEIVFFSFVVAPAAFGVLEAARAGEVVGAIFPRYYALGMAAGTVALLGAVVLGRRASHTAGWTGAVVVLAVGLAATVWAGMVVHPRAQRMRIALQAAGEAAGTNADFQLFHRRAVMLNGVALVAGLLGLGFSAASLRQ